MDSDTDHIVSSLNLEVLNNHNTWNYLTVGQLISSLTFLNVNLLHIIHIYLNVCKQMTVKLLLLHSNSGNHLTVCKQRNKLINRMIHITRNTWNHLTEEKRAQGCSKNVIRKMFTHHVYLIYKSKQDSVLNKFQCSIWHKTKSTYKELFLTFELHTYVKLNCLKWNCFYILLGVKKTVLLYV